MLAFKCLVAPGIFISTTFMLGVTSSRAPECVEVQFWNCAFPIPPCHQGAVVIVVVVDKLRYTRLNKGYVGSAFLDGDSHDIKIFWVQWLHV